ncbi:hypothetical protein BT69DRAFT_1351750 [Atractiella rhizophila]|nr:hypothetical protein BT69DRAFT_1351750 [Atractiella rhizophila]
MASTSPVDPITGAITPVPYTKELALKNVYPLVVGQFFSFALFGVSSLQFYYCFKLLARSTRKETYNFLTLVAFAILDLADQIGKGEFFWKYIESAVTLGLSSAFVPGPKVSYVNSVVGGATIPIACHIYYMVRIYRISRNWKWRNLVVAGLGFCLLVSIMASVFALITGRVGFRKPIDYGHDLRTLPVPWLAGDAFVDIVLSLILVVYLRSQRSEFKDTNALINKWIFISLESGLLSAICAMGDLLLAVIFPNEPYHFAVNYILTKVYINSVLILFHTVTRNRVKGRDTSSDGSTNPRYTGSLKQGITVETAVVTQNDDVPHAQVVSFEGQPKYKSRDHLDDEEASYREKGTVAVQVEDHDR